MLDLYIKRIIIHQFSPNDTELVLAEGPLEITPRLDEYFRKKLSKVFSDEAKRGYSMQRMFHQSLGDDLMESSVKIAQLWKEEFVISEDQKTNDLVFIQFDKEGQEYFAFLRIALKDSLIHSLGDSQHPIQLSQNNLPSAAQTPDEALVINRSSKQYYLIEKRIKHNGALPIISLKICYRFSLNNLSKNRLRWLKILPRRLPRILIRMTLTSKEK